MFDIFWRNIRVTVERIGASPDDPDDVRLHKSMLTAMATLSGSFAVL